MCKAKAAMIETRIFLMERKFYMEGRAGGFIIFYFHSSNCAHGLPNLRLGLAKVLFRIGSSPKLLRASKGDDSGLDSYF